MESVAHKCVDSDADHSCPLLVRQESQCNDSTFVKKSQGERNHSVKLSVDGNVLGLLGDDPSETLVSNEDGENVEQNIGENDDYCCHGNYYDDDNYDEYGDEYYEPFNYGDGFYPETFDVVKGIIHDLIKATRKSGVAPEDAENYLLHVLGVCNLEQREKLMTVKTGVHLPLSLACDIGNLKVVQFLVENCNADVDGVNGSPLMWAIIHGHEDIVHYLLECNVDFNMKICKDLNMIMLAMKVFPEGCSGYTFHEEVENESETGSEIAEGDKVSVKFNCKIEVVKMLMDRGAIKACSKSQLFHCIQVLAEPGSEDIHQLSLLLLMDYIEKHIDVDSIRNNSGCSILGQEYKRLHLLTPFCKQLMEMGADIKNVNILRFISAQKLEFSNQHTVETNVNHILSSCSFGSMPKKTNFEKESESYVGLLVYFASHGSSLHAINFLSMSDFSYQEKFDCLEMTGAYCALQGYFAIAMKCWQTANELKQQKCIRVTRKRTYHETSERPDNVSVLENFEISLNESQNLPYPTHGMGMTFQMLAYFTDLANKVITGISENYSNRIRDGIIPELIVHPPTCSFMELLKDCGSLICDTIAEETRLKILTKTALIYERLIGYGSWDSMRAFKELMSEYLQVGNVIAYVTVVTYCLPYFIKYVPHDKWFDKEEYIKDNMIKTLVYRIRNKDCCNNLSFDLLMAVFKCFFLDCWATPRKDRAFYEFGPMLLSIKILHSRNKSKEEDLRFSNFLKSVVKADPRNKYGQTLLHHVVPTLSNDSIDPYMTYDSSPLKEEICGSVELLKLLLSFGANPNAYDDNGRTPFHFCFYMMPNFIWECKDDTPCVIVDLLLEAGAHADCFDAEGRTPIDDSRCSLVQLNAVENRSLQCLAARSVLEQNIPYKESLACHLVDFVDLHKNRGIRSLLNFPEHMFG